MSTKKTCFKIRIIKFKNIGKERYNKDEIRNKKNTDCQETFS